ncbi:MAG: hypothetical protein QGI83_19195 [Candidatus Latescibacteria bacterium]|nr:hypothetical protein [Candidatus Latescibacterota bacterium]
MELLYKPDFEDARAHWEAFWNREIIDRPCLAVRAPKEGSEIPPAPPYMDGWDGDFAEAVARWEARAEHTYFAADAVPFLEPSFGPDQFGAFLGADLERSKDSFNRTSWAVPYVEDWRDALPIRLDPDTMWWKKMLEFMRVAGKASEGKYLVGMLDMHSNLDALASIREPEDLCMDLIDCPELVHLAMADVRALYAEIYDALREAANMTERGSIGWISFYSPHRFAVMQCDFAIMVSPGMFNAFILPALEEEATFLDHSIYHYDGEGALRHLDEVLAIENLDGIQWVPGAGKPAQTEWPELLARIQDAGKSLHVSGSVDRIKHLHGILKPEGVYYETTAKNEREAEEIVGWFVRNT